MRAPLLIIWLTCSLWPAMGWCQAGRDGQALTRSDIVIAQPNVLPNQAMGLGNGRLGAAFWAEDGLTLQLNRIDTLPYRRSPGQVSLPGLALMTSDRRFKGRVNLYDGTLEETGGGITLIAWVDKEKDRVVLHLSGLPLQKPQAIRLRLWSPRNPVALTHDGIAVLSEAWIDDQLPGASGRHFGSLAAIRANGRQLEAKVVDARTVEVTALPNADGSLEVVIASPAYDGSQSALDAARSTLSSPPDRTATTRWWHAFWSRANLIEADSPDGTARYAETLRTLYLFAAAAHSGGDIPGSQGGIADLFSASKDDHMWDPAAFWFWNLRMQVAANLAAGLPELNDPVFALYRHNLDALQRWTRLHMKGSAGICVPETMRFNGNGVEYENARFRPFAIVTHSCDLAWSASSNARTLSTGAEIGLWVWRTYLQTGNRDFLHANYPLMAEAARFLLAYQKPGADGLLHTAPSNAHETQMDVTDPATDISAIRSLYPATIAAARVLKRDDDLVAQLQNALQRTPPLPLMSSAQNRQLRSSSNASGDEVLAPSYVPEAPYQNGENIALEAVWPYALIGLDDPLFAVAKRTYAQRPFVYQATWSYDPVQAVRLGLGDDAAQAIFQLVQLYQVYTNGMAALVPGPPDEFYLEQAGVVAVTLSDMLAIQDADGLIRVGLGIPHTWTISGDVSLAHGVSIHVDAANGVMDAFDIRGGDGSPMQFATAWEGHSIRVMQGGELLKTLPGGRFTFSPLPGKNYRFELVGDVATPRFADHASPTVKTLGRSAIGLSPPCCEPPPGYDTRSDMRDVEQPATH